jgi:hypothetical protein
MGNSGRIQGLGPVIGKNHSFVTHLCRHVSSKENLEFLNGNHFIMQLSYMLLRDISGMKTSLFHTLVIF